MVWNELKKYRIEDIVLFVNEKLLELGSLKAIADTLEVNESTIRKKLNSHGYKRVNNKFVLNDDTCNIVKDNHKEKDITQNITNVISTTEFKDNMFYLNNEIDTLKSIIEQFKAKDDKSNIDVIQLVEGIKIELPQADIKRTTIRINEKVWDMFNDFVEANKPFDKHDLMGQALLDYMDKHKKD